MADNSAIERETEKAIGRRVFSAQQMAWVNEARTRKERDRRLADLKSRHAGEAVMIDGQWVKYNG